VTHGNITCPYCRGQSHEDVAKQIIEEGADREPATPEEEADWALWADYEPTDDVDEDGAILINLNVWAFYVGHVGWKK